MITLIQKGLPSHDATSLDVAGLKISLIDNRYKNGIVGYEQPYIDLTQLTQVQLFREYPDIDKRKKEAEEKLSQKRNERAILGAVIGGVVDGSSGDDSVLDGAIAGAAIGALSAGSVQVDLKEQSEHVMNLLFRDGNSLKVKADVEGIADLFQIIHKINVLHGDIATEPYLKYRKLTDIEVETANRVAKTKLEAREETFSTILMFIFALSCFGFLIYGVDTFRGVEGFIRLEVLVTVSIGSLLSYFVLRRNEKRKIAELLEKGQGQAKPACASHSQ